MSVNVEKTKEKTVKRKREVRKKYKLIDVFGCLKGKIFYDDAIFNLGINS